MVPGSLSDSPAAIPAASTGSRAVQAKLWGARAKDWAELESIHNPIYAAALERLKIREGDKLLDIGCGAGGFCGLAHEKGAHVVGLDATPELLQVAKERFPECTFDEGEMETLPYRNAEFDFVTAFNSFQFASNPQTAAYEGKRVMKVGALLLITTWANPEQCEATAYFEALKRLSPPPEGAVGPFALSKPGLVEEMVTKVRLDVEDTMEVDCVWEFANQEAMLRRLMSSGPANRVISEVGEDKVKETLIACLARFATPEGGYRLKNVFRIVVAAS